MRPSTRVPMGLNVIDNTGNLSILDALCVRATQLFEDKK